jgi:outer membrane protein OmpA-like peptidoglycan-associated protein
MSNTISFRKPIVIAVIAAFAAAGCATDEYGRSRPMTDAEKGAIIGAVSGAVVGAAVSKKDKRTKGAVIGAIGGGLAGTAVGTYMDNQKRDFEKALAPERGAGAITIEKLPANALRVTMTAQTAFEVDSSQIKGGFYSTMDKISRIVNTYGKTTLDVIGHTDSTGSNEHNQRLSEHRAQAVAQYLLGRNVARERLSAEGMGESAPRASNATAEGRALNRRVEIVIEPVVANGSG